ncbi:30S ribosomal protein S8 [bacterium I07]|nr:30S ribosomal protein S8 [bacterium I07]
MSITDPIADYLTQVRNATRAKHSKVDIPASNLLKQLTQILMEEGYVRNFTFLDDSPQGHIRIYLKYNADRKSAITGIKRISRPGYRRYTSVQDIPRVLNGLGVAILTTPRGLLVDRNARKEGVGGEILCHVW